jgi:methanogenic corrinoid protein MtbC1
MIAVLETVGFDSFYLGIGPPSIDLVDSAREPQQQRRLCAASVLVTTFKAFALA